MEKNKRKKILKKIRFKTLFLLALTLASNSFAWFIYSTRINNNITAEVKSWRVNFEVGQGESAEDYIEFDVDVLYPGMTPYTRTINVNNDGEADAQINFEILSGTILGKNVFEGGFTSDQLINRFGNYYPFAISIISTPSIVEAGNTGVITFSVSWPYESNNDVVDTQWGSDAYDFRKVNPTDPCIELLIKMTAVQLN